MPYAVHFTLKSSNRKTGPIPVSTTSSNTCPSACPLKGSGCYAEAGPLGMLWSALSSATPGEKVKRGSGHMSTMTWKQFTTAIAALPDGTLWRHNQAGDLPGKGNKIDKRALAALIVANTERRGFTYTHKPLNGPNRVAIKVANDNGFTINLSADTLVEADQLADAAIAPVVVVLPHTVAGNRKDLQTPAGRKVVVCPATYRDDVSCASCQLCQRADRQVIVGFPAHGQSKKRATAIALS